MINIQQLIEEENKNGYYGEKATAKVCQDIILKALSLGPMRNNITIKGGVVMRSKTNNVRRATSDLDMDFIKYSLDDKAIDIFISKLNCIEGINICREGKVLELKQQDYKGKQVYVLIKDLFGNQIKSKIDFGVHKRFEIEQEEYCFDIAYDDEGASLLINSDEQMLAEKLKSLLKFGSFSTRYKDIYDMYYLINTVNIEKFKMILKIYIFDDGLMRENSVEDIIKRFNLIFRDKVFVKNIDKSDKRWIDENINVIIKEIIEFFVKL